MTNSVETFIANELASRRASVSAADINEARAYIAEVAGEVLEHRRYPAQSVRNNGNAAYSMFHGDCHVLYNGVMGGAGITLLQCKEIDTLRFDVPRVAKWGMGGYVTETLRQIADCIDFGSKSEKELWLLDRSVDSVLLVGDDRYLRSRVHWQWLYQAGAYRRCQGSQVARDCRRSPAHRYRRPGVRRCRG